MSTVTVTPQGSPTAPVAPNPAAEVQTSTNEAPQAQPEVKQDEIAKKYYLLAKKEQQVRSQAREIQTQKAQMAQREAEIRSQVEREYRERFKANPLDEISQAGLSWDELTTQALNNPPPSREQIELQRLRQELDSIKKSQEESTTRQYEQAKNQIRNDARLLVQGDERFETIQAMDGLEEVVNLIEYTFQKDGVVLDVETAAEEVEKYLFEERAEKIAKLKKMQSKFGQPAAQPSSAAPQQPAGRSPTLTNSVGSTGKPLSAKERAILAFKGQLK